LARERRSNGSVQRTEQERERAREERERRRLAKAGADRPPPLAPPLPAPLPEPPAVEQPQPSRRSPAVVESQPSRHSPVVEESQPSRRSPAVEQSQPSKRLPALESPSRALDPPRSHRPHLHLPHRHRPGLPRRRGRFAKAAALLGLLLVLGALAFTAVLLVHRSERPKIPPTPTIVRVTIPEGYTRAQIAALAHADGLRGSYLLPSKSFSELHPSRYGAPRTTPSLEGFLFPATYDMDAGALASRLVSEQLAAFRENFGGGEVHRAKVLGVTPYQLLTVASIVEREAGIPHDRRLVAAVVYNRLRLGMTLGIDATLRYALHDFTHPLTQAELSSSSPYNTRTHTGLPPTPISNPGAAAIAAAAHPAKVSYLYYVAGADGCGEQVFSTSYAEFEKNASAYRQALRRNGGRVPTCKKK
jgi:UPF0755 protein